MDLIIEEISPKRSVSLAQSHPGGDGPPGLVEQLCEVLAGVMELDNVTPSAGFFDELGADSMTMAHFCARLSKRDDLPSVSVKQVYQHPSIDALAAALAPAEPLDSTDPSDHAAEASADPVSTRSRHAVAPNASPPVAAWRYLLCGAAQVVAAFEFIILFAFVLAWGYEWIAPATGLVSIYWRSAVFGSVTLIAWSALSIAAKWILVGRWRPQQIQLWSLGYVGFWFVRALIRTNPLVLFAGSPIYVLYLRALGAKIGSGVVILSGRVPACTDLLTIGSNTVIRKDSTFNCYRAEAGMIRTGPVTIGNDAFVGEAAVLDLDSSLGDGAQLGHSSSLHAGQAVPPGERRHGSPALQPTDVDYRVLGPIARSRRRRFGYSAVQLILLFVLAVPLAIGLLVALVEWRLSGSRVPWSDAPALSGSSLYSEALFLSTVVFAVFFVVALVFISTVPRLLGRAIRADEVYPLYGVRYWIQGIIARLTNVPFFNYFFGDSSYVVRYLSWLGYDISFEDQTGANFGLEVKHDNPLHVRVGPGVMASDGLSIINTDYSPTSFRVSEAVIGSHSFFGNYVTYPPDGRTGDNCLHATKVLVPVDGDERRDAGLLGSPSFEIPRLVMRDQNFDEMATGDERRARLSAKNRHNAITMAWFLLVRWVAGFAGLLLALAAVDRYPRYGAWVIVGLAAVFFFIGPLYAILVERAASGFGPLLPTYCSMYEREMWVVERYWKLAWQPFVYDGTPLKNLAWRLLGVRLGRRVFDDGCLIMEKTMVTIGDHCVLNAGSVIQPHSQEDGTYKSDRISIGDRCTIGVGALVHYGVTMGQGATLEADSFLMKGSEVPAGTTWGDNPARQLDDKGARTT